MLGKSYVTLGSLILTLQLAAVEPGIKTQFVGGTVSGIALKTSVRLDLTGADRLIFHLDIPSLGFRIRRSIRWSTGRR